jgi:hypothetical protein
MEILPWLRQSFSDVSSAPAPRFSPSSVKEKEIDPSVMAEIPSRNYSRSPAPLSATETILNKVKSYADPRKAISLAAELIADPTNFLPQLKGSKIAAGAIGTFFAKNSPFWNPRLADSCFSFAKQRSQAGRYLFRHQYLGESPRRNLEAGTG